MKGIKVLKLLDISGIFYIYVVTAGEFYVEFSEQRLKIIINKKFLSNFKFCFIFDIGK